MTTPIDLSNMNYNVVKSFFILESEFHKHVYVGCERKGNIDTIIVIKNMHRYLSSEVPALTWQLAFYQKFVYPYRETRLFAHAMNVGDMQFYLFFYISAYIFS